jgi:hypothetical protein
MNIFCEKCGNVRYNTDMDDDKLKYSCNTTICNNTYYPENDVTVYSETIDDDNVGDSNYDYNININTKYDRTYRILKKQCPNKDCDSYRDLNKNVGLLIINIDKNTNKVAFLCNVCSRIFAKK